MLKPLLKRALCCIVFAVVILSALFFIFYRKDADGAAEKYYKTKLHDNSNPTEENIPYNDVSIPATAGINNNRYKKYVKIYKDNKETLVLANRDNPLPDGYMPSLKYICNGRLQASSIIYDDLVQMLDDAKEHGYSFWIASAYRSAERQQQLVDEDVNTFMCNGMSYNDALEEVYKETMPAGCSEHQTGLALDILCSGNSVMDISQKEEPGNKWLRKNCYKYGFILRYPEDKTDITRINPEPWHFRYVGRKAAKFMYRNQITLEEFYNALSTQIVPG